MLLEDDFMKNALQFLEEIGADTSEVEPETDLFDGVLDSLGTLAFLDFLEQQRDDEIDIDNLHLDSISTLRNAYRFVLAVE
jgi:acyl carrier protein